MCGIAGLIGKSKHPKISHHLATKLFERSETRGTDASGFWGCQPGEEGSVVFHKEPRKATSFVHSDQWKRLLGMNLNVLIMHARQSSQGVGDAGCNKNNHPFVNSDKSVGLVHNGRIYEYTDLKKRYETKSDCDSEVLLRIFEAARASHQTDEIAEGCTAPPDIVSSIHGIREIFAYANDSHMAVAIGERLGSRRDLWLFHNHHRPLWVVDAREGLGQMFFCSTPEIWATALRECPQAMGVLGGRRHKIVPMPTEEAWYFSVDDDSPIVEGQGKGYYGFRFSGENEYTPWDDEAPAFPVSPATRNVPVLCDLGDNDELTKTCHPTYMSRHQKRHDRNKHQWEDQSTRYNERGVVWNKDGTARYDDEADLELTDLNDDDPDESVWQTNDDIEERYHGMRALQLDAEHNLIPHTDRHISAIGKSINKKLEERNVAVGYDSDPVDYPDYNDNSYNEYGGFDVQGLERVIRDIVQTANNIETSALNMAREGSLTAQNFQDNLEALQQILMDLKGNQGMIEGF
jgi:predicted glutamine amidotransferase